MNKILTVGEAVRENMNTVINDNYYSRSATTIIPVFS